MDWTGLESSPGVLAHSTEACFVQVAQGHDRLAQWLKLAPHAAANTAAAAAAAARAGTSDSDSASDIFATGKHLSSASGKGARINNASKDDDMNDSFSGIVANSVGGDGSDWRLAASTTLAAAPTPEPALTMAVDDDAGGDEDDNDGGAPPGSVLVAHCGRDPWTDPWTLLLAEELRARAVSPDRQMR